MIDVALVRCRELPEPDNDMDLLQTALAARGLEVAWWSWDDPAVRWAEARMAVVRATWNYYLDYEAFVAWIDRASSATRLYNPASVLRWNSDKKYLGELTGNDVRVVPTLYVSRGEVHDLAASMDAHGWERVVVKPRVSAGSYETYTYARGEVTAETVTRHAAARDVMVQPFVKSVETYGERSVVVIDGEISHAMRKSPRFVGASEATKAVTIEADEGAFAKAVLECVREPLLYARVDMARDEEGKLMVMELEACEPSLFLGSNAEGLERFVRAIEREARS